MQGNQFKYNNLSVNLNIISSFQFVNGKNTFFWKKLSEHKAISISHFLLLFRVIIFTIGFVLFCGFLLLLFLFLSFSWQFFYYCFPFFNFFITVFFYWKLHGGFFHSDLTYNKYCTAIASFDAQSHIWAVLMSLDLFSLFNTDILRPTTLAIITIYHLILLPFFILSKTP